jgi:hypothetical protein
VKAIGIFVSVLLVSGGIAMYFYTRPPDRVLDRQGEAWVTAFRAWNAEMARSLDRAEVSIGVSRGERLAPSLIPRLEACRTSLREVGLPPTLLERALDEGRFACGEVEHGLSLYDAYGSPALASTELHLKRAAHWLVAAETTIERRLHPDTAPA